MQNTKNYLKISVQTGDWYDDRFGGDANADEAFAFLRSCGFDTIDYNIDHTLPGSLIKNGIINTFYDASVDELIERYRPVRKALDRNGISIGQAHAPFPLHVEGMDSVNDYLIQVIEKECAILSMLGAPALVVHPYSCSDKEKEWEINLAMYRRMIPAAQKYGITLCLENMFRFRNGHTTVGACGEAEEACRYIDTLNQEAGSPVFGYCFDVGHANLCSRDIYREICTLGHRLTILHIHDNDGLLDLHQIPFTLKTGDGQLCTDWEGFINGLRDIHYRGTLNFETFGGLKNVPQELYGPLLCLIYQIGCYFRDRILS